MKKCEPRGTKPAQSRTGRFIRMVIWRVLWLRQVQNSQKYSVMSHVGVCCYWPVKCRYLTPKLKKKNKKLFWANLWVLRDWFIFRTSFHLPSTQGSSPREMVRFYFYALWFDFTIAFSTSLNIATIAFSTSLHRDTRTFPLMRHEHIHKHMKWNP